MCVCVCVCVSVCVSVCEYVCVHVYKMVLQELRFSVFYTTSSYRFVFLTWSGCTALLFFFANSLAWEMLIINPMIAIMKASVIRSENRPALGRVTPKLYVQMEKKLLYLGQTKLIVCFTDPTGLYS